MNTLKTEQPIRSKRSPRSLSARIMGAMAVILPLSVALAQPLEPVVWSQTNSVHLN